MTRLPAALLVAVWLAAPAVAAAEQDDLARAKELYVTAAYDEALAVLDALKAAPTADAVEVAEYRVFCLLALDRRDEARQTIAGLVSANPLYHLPEGQVSPRIQTVFREIRRQVFPDVVQHAYADAKASFDGHDPGAAAKFDRVVALLDDPDAQGVPALADLRTVAAGFRDLSKAAAAPPPSAPASQLPAPAASPQAQSTAPAQTAAKVDGAASPPEPQPRTEPESPTGTATVIPPVAIYQPIPPWITSTPTDQQQEFRGTLELLIDRLGHVTNVKLRKSVNPRYDAELIRVARTWRFRPATKDGQPMPFVKVVDVQLIPK